MGVNQTKVKSLKSNEIVEFSKVSTFTADEINELYLFYNQLSKSSKDDGVIDYEEFCRAIGIPDCLYTRNLFKIFDTNSDKVINFREFIIGFATFLNETIDKQIKLSFKIYDPKDRGYALKSEMHEILKGAFQGLQTIDLPAEALKEVVEQTFEDWGSKEHPDQISFEQYEKMVYENNDIIKWLAIDMHKVSQGAKLLLANRAVIKNIAPGGSTS